MNEKTETTKCPVCGMIIKKNPGYSHMTYDCIAFMKQKIKELENPAFVYSTIQTLANLELTESDIKEIFPESDPRNLNRTFKRMNHDPLIFWHTLNQKEKNQFAKHIATLI